MLELIKDVWGYGWGGRLLLLSTLLCIAIIPLTVWAIVLEQDRCTKMGGRMISKTTSGVITTSTVSFCVSRDGRVLF